MDVIGFTPRPLYPWGKRPQYPLDRRLGGPQSRFARYGEGKNLASIRNQKPAVQYVMLKLVVRIVMYRGVTIDGVLAWFLDLSTTLTYDS
jgi:hypothetical protein